MTSEHTQFDHPQETVEVKRKRVAGAAFEEYFASLGYQYGAEEKSDAKYWFVDGYLKSWENHS